MTQMKSSWIFNTMGRLKFLASKVFFWWSWEFSLKHALKKKGISAYFTHFLFPEKFLPTYWLVPFCCPLFMGVKTSRNFMFFREVVLLWSFSILNYFFTWSLSFIHWMCLKFTFWGAILLFKSIAVWTF